jgi:hypothetical protein
MASAKGLTVTLLIPGLYGFTPQQWQEIIAQLPQLPGLSALLSRCGKIQKTPTNFESLLKEKFALSEHEPLPIAALTYWHDCGHPPQNYVLRADPVHLKADRDCLYLLGYESLEVSREEANKLAEEINRLYSDEGWSLKIGSPHRWYICAEKMPLIETDPLTQVFGKNIANYLPRGREEKKWRIVLTELQMLLHNSAVNLQRATNRQLAINSVWLWGEGQLADFKINSARTVDYLWSNQPLCLGLARWAECSDSTMPQTAREWIEQAEFGHHLIVCDDMRLLARERFQSWVDKLIQLDELWFLPLMEAFDNKLLTDIKVEMETGLTFEMGKRSKWNKWRRKKRLWYEWYN